MGKVVVNEAYLDLLKACAKVEEQPLLRAKHLPKYLTEKPIEVPLEHQNMYVDTRYNTPKEEPKASQESINKTIAETEIYRRTKLVILEAKEADTELYEEVKDIILYAQEKQVAYGIDKYPEPLNPNTWSIVETINHIIDESIDKLHYLVMLRIKLEQSLVGKNGMYTWSSIQNIDNMIGKAIRELYHVVIMRIKFEREMAKEYVKPINTDSFDALSYALRYNTTASKEVAAGADMDGDKTLVSEDEKGKKYVTNIDIDKLLNSNIWNAAELKKAGLI